jgi:hypothetical protein
MNSFMKIFNKRKYLVLCFWMLSGTVNSQITTSQLSGQKPNGTDINTITTAVPFLMIAPDSRAGGMGDVGVASSPDANSIHWNPSKLAFIEKNVGFALSYTPWLRSLVPDINLAYLSGYKRLDKTQVVAASLRYFSLGNIAFTDVVGNSIGQFNPNEFALDAAYSRKLSENFSVGMAARYIYSNLTGNLPATNSTPTHAGMAVAVDASGYYQKEIDISAKKSLVAFGLNISNVGSRISYTETGKRDFIPINMRLGGSLKMELDQYNTFSFMLDANKLLVPSPPIYDPANNQVILYGRDPNVGVAKGIFGSFNDAPAGAKEELHEINYSTGLEYWYDKQFAIRAGYFYEHPTKGNRQYLTFGAGLKYNVFGLDFAYVVPTSSQNSPLANTLRFTLLFDFDGFKAQNKTEGN